MRSSFRTARAVAATALGLAASACCLIAILAQRYVAELDDETQAANGEQDDAR